jgi:UDP-N-acetyl-D-mannosaminuronic acid dehydrogenase
MMKNICVIGMGYIGLPTAVFVAKSGFQVYGCDIDEFVVKTINAGNIHIAEPDLLDITRQVVSSGLLVVDVTPRVSDVYIIAVPTPIEVDGESRTPDLRFVYSALESISTLLKKGDLVILESTSPVGTTRKLKQYLNDKNVDTDDMAFAYCPERVLPGNIVKEFTSNARVVGGLSSEDTRLAADFYKSFINAEVSVTEAETAELCKLVENSFRDLNIAFANELSLYCENKNIDVWKLIKLANKHPRVEILQPGIGVGGHCIAVDPWFLISSDPENSKLSRLARGINDSKTKWVIDKIMTKVSRLIEVDGLNNPKIALLGLTFKPNIDDIRESPAAIIAQEIIKKYKNVALVEPNISSLKDYKLEREESAVSNADLVVILVKHNQFIDSYKKGIFKTKRLLDFCNLTDESNEA